MVQKLGKIQKKQLHRKNGPAVIFTNGNMFWLINNENHRFDGPSRVYFNGMKYWYLENNFIRHFSYD